MKKHYKYIILGAGISGVSAGYFLNNSNHLIIEKSSEKGGLLKSQNKNNFTWDLGPHLSFTSHLLVKKIIKKAFKFISYEKVIPYNFYKGRFFPHPIQSHLGFLESSLKKNIKKDLEKKNSLKINPKKNYGNWLIYHFGTTIFSNFFLPYTLKYWTISPFKLSLDWMGNRIQKINKKNLLSSLENIKPKNVNYINKVKYPKKGGFFTLIKYLSKGLNIQYDIQINAIDLKSKSIFLKNGLTISYDFLISTINLKDFIFLTNIYKKNFKYLEYLSSTSLKLINIEVDQKIDSQIKWFYIYDKDIPFSRVTVIDNLSKFNSPNNKTGLQIELYNFDKKLFYEKNERLIKLAISFIKKLNLFHKKKLKFKGHVIHIKNANIICNTLRQKSLINIYSKLKKHGLLINNQMNKSNTNWEKIKYYNQKSSFALCGRFAEWKYYWSDDCIMSAYNIVKKIKI